MKIIQAFIKKHAFTLVEGSIALVIIGALAGGVTAGKHLIDQAKIKAVVSEINAIQISAQKFQETYGGLPGDLPYTSGLSASATAGNGDGSISTISEARNFWIHLQLANLLPPTLNTAQIVTPSDGSPPIIPSQKQDGGGYTVTSNGQVLRIGFSAYTTTTSNNAALTPNDAHNIDASIDDGKPNTGVLTAIQGADVATANICTESTGNAYNLDQTVKACRITFDFKLTSTVEDPTAVDCNGADVGTSRVSSSQTCETGYIGKVIESCTTEANVTQWRTTRKICELRECAEGVRVGQTRTLACPENYTGSITLTCQNNGIFKTTTNSCVALTSSGCTAGDTRLLACPFGQVGVLQQECNAGTWQTHSTDPGSCSNIQCGSAVIGDNITSTATCPFNHSGGSGSVQEACTMLGQKVVGSTCRPDYGNCTTGNTRNISCPSGETGDHFQICNPSGYWETNEATGGNTCQAITCGGEPIGATRLSQDRPCPLNRPGSVFEVCDSDGSWKLSYANCPAETCPAGADTLGNANWNNGPYASGEVHTSTDCLPTYAGSAVRRCDLGGNWLAPTQECTVFASCSAETNPTIGGIPSYTSWALTPLASSPVTITPDGDITTLQDHTCIAGYLTPTPITRACVDPGGGNPPVWQDPSGSCIPGIEGMY